VGQQIAVVQDLGNPAVAEIPLAGEDLGKPAVAEILAGEDLEIPLAGEDRAVAHREIGFDLVVQMLAVLAEQIAVAPPFVAVPAVAVVRVVALHEVVDHAEVAVHEEVAGDFAVAVLAEEQTEEVSEIPLPVAQTVGEEGILPVVLEQMVGAVPLEHPLEHPLVFPLEHPLVFPSLEEQTEEGGIPLPVAGYTQHFERPFAEVHVGTDNLHHLDNYQIG